jgi:hypothetical protein
MSVLHDAPRRSRLASGWGQLELPLVPRGPQRPAMRHVPPAPPKLLSKAARALRAAPSTPPLTPAQEQSDGR